MNEDIYLYNDNCIKVMQKLPDNSVDLILTDPPYNIGNFMKDRQTNLNRMRKNFFVGAGWDNEDYHDWLGNMTQFFVEAHRILKTKGTLIMFMSVLKVESIIELAQTTGFYYKTTGIWHKTNPMPRNMNLHFVNSNEPWLYFINDGKTGTFNNKGKLELDFIQTSVTPASEKKFGKHPTQKPVTLMDHFINLLSNPGDTVLDPFMGSGTTGVSAVSNDRKFIGIEVSEEYYKLSKRRILNNSI
ncbi:site-specific DNA-methyltransferase [Lactobacillus crispatus]|uniref:DNA-methyltransferase n=1 Tax=Lactobacillus crispatus TaxID=47770 RepID=UPI0014766D48|nr:site-specific DNA-methyltransferase [Lactobacillus crispatus]MBA2916123.1 site-specific DNA-methyltransferase [Lactobacillus crispatus]MBD0968545.1 site-specific DNA-methyltransferase [Lactobacillus crispatus]MBE5058856.1 site-specific DNA-methyltransferase [Lactobacillus crispatus]NME26614.1 site-specific DNA-methyltransferase [Lactobacillus crispatus]